MIQRVPAEIGDVKIRVSVIVVIADSDSHPVARATQPCRERSVRESAVAVIAVKTIPKSRVLLIRLRSWRHRVGQLRAVNKKDVEQTVVIVIKERNSAVMLSIRYLRDVGLDWLLK